MTYSEKVIELIQTGQLEAVNENIELALLYDDDDTIYLLGNTLFQLGFLEETKRVYNHLIDVNPNDDELKIYLAEIEIEDGNELEALELLHAIDQTSPSYAQSLLVQADYYHINGLPEVSIQKLSEALELAPNEPIIQFALGEVYFSIGEYQEALQYYEMLIEEGVEEVGGTLIHSRLGNANLMLANYDKASEHLNEVLSLKDNPEVYYQLGYIHIQQEEYTKAIDSINEARTIDPTLISVYVLLAEAYEHLNQLEYALEAIEEGIKFNEVSVELYLLAAEYAAKLSNFEKAKQYYQQALSMEPENEQVVIKYGTYLNFMGEYEEVIELFEQSPDTMKDLPEAMWILAKANNETDEYDQARALYDQAYQYLDDNLDYLKEYAFFLREDGQRDQLYEVLTKYTTMEPEYDEEIASLLEDFTY